MSKERELLEKLFNAASKLDNNYCTVMNRNDFSLGMNGEEYDEINDVFIEVENYLNEAPKEKETIQGVLDEIQEFLTKEVGRMQNTINDCYVDFVDERPSDETIVAIYKQLPESIKQDAKQWGAGDTVVGDNVYRWLEKNIEKFK